MPLTTTNSTITNNKRYRTALYPNEQHWANGEYPVFLSRPTNISLTSSPKNNIGKLEIKSDDTQIPANAPSLMVREVLPESIVTLYIIGFLRPEKDSSTAPVNEKRFIFLEQEAKKDSSLKSDSPTADSEVGDESSTDTLYVNEGNAGVIDKDIALVADSSEAFSRMAFEHNVNHGPEGSIAVKLKITPEHLTKAQSRLYFYKGKEIEENCYETNRYFIALPENKINCQIVEKVECKIAATGATDQITCQVAENSKPGITAKDVDNYFKNRAKRKARRRRIALPN